MSSNTIDYSDDKIDAGGDTAYDSSNYGTTTGDLSSDSKPSQGDLGSGGSGKTQKVSNGGPGLRASGQDVVNHEQWGKNSGSTERPVGNHEEGMTSDETRSAQGYSKTNDSNPDIGG